jgi:hypothetical protein
MARVLLFFKELLNSPIVLFWSGLHFVRFAAQTFLLCTVVDKGPLARPRPRPRPPLVDW